MLRSPLFRKELNELRSHYQDWVQGPPIFDFQRKDITLDSHVWGYPAQFLEEWSAFEQGWDIDLPKPYLTKDQPDLARDRVSADLWPRLQKL